MIETSFSGIPEVNAMLKGVTGDDLIEVKKELKRSVLKVDRMIIQGFGGDIQTRTGALKRSFGFEVKGSTYNDLVAGNYSNSPYAPIQEFGGEIKAIDKYMGVPGGPYMNIPTKSNQTPSGVTRYTPKAVFTLMGGYVAKIQGGYGVFIGSQGPMEKGTGRNQDVMMYYLVKSVTLEAKLNMRKSQEEVAKEAIPNIAKIIGTST